MADATSNKTKISLKLMVHKQQKRVIFAEADSSFVDTLFSFTTLPLGTIARLLEKLPDERVKALGSLRNLYKSLTNLPDIYMSSDESKFVMLNPRSSLFDHCRNCKLNINDTEPVKYFTCQCIWPDPYPYFSILYVSSLDFSNCNLARCIDCGKRMCNEITVTDSTSITRVGVLDDSLFVSNVSSYIVTDDLCVMPNTSGIVIQLFRQYGITDASHIDIEERTLDIGLEQILILLNSVLIFKHPLTYMLFSSSDLIGGLNNVKQEPLVHPSIDNTTGTSSKKMPLKVTLQKSTLKFLFAEADSDFVEFVFGFLEIPLGTAIGKLLNGTSSLHTMNNLYASVSNLPVGKSIKSQHLKDMLLEPQLVLKYLSQNQIFPVTVLTSSFSVEYKNETLRLKDARVQECYLKPSAKFMLTDDLIITPLSSTSTLALLSKLKVPFADIEEHEVVIGIEEGLKILKASLNSVTTLTDAIVKEIVKNKI